jgi:FixJ family two-component response regulator
MSTSPAQARPRVFLVDDDAQILKALGRLLRAAGFEVEPFASAREFLERHDADIPGCAVLDVGMEELDGLSLQEMLVSGDAPRPIVFLTGRDDVSSGVRAMKAGAIDYLTKPVQDETLIGAINAALAFDQAARDQRQVLGAYAARLLSLTPREREVMEHVVAGRLNKQIAHDLGTVEKTIKVHRAHIMEKMQVRSVAALVHIAEQMRNAKARTRR